MKKLFLIVALFFVYSVNAQSIIQLDPDFRPTENNTSIPVSRDAQDVTVTWLENGAEESNAIAFNSLNYGAFMEFTPDDLINFNNSGRQMTKVKQINFHLYETHYSSVTSCSLVILQGASFNTATQVASQNVPVSALTGGWNNINLTSPYVIDPTLNLYIGFRMAHPSGVYPLSVVDGDNQKQAWARLYYSNGEQNMNILSEADYNFMIKALVETEDTPENELSLQEIEIEKYRFVGDRVNIEGTVKNLGTEAITSFSITYDINGTETDESFTGLNILPNTTYDFTSTHTHEFTQAGTNTIFKVTISLPNGQPDSTYNNTLETMVITPSERVPRKVFHEGFTSSTCAPCRPGNVNFKNIIQAADPSKWVCVKYQMNFPGSGDPYYTLEAGARRDFYGINGVPSMVVDGMYLFDTRDYTLAYLNQLAEVPACARMTSEGTVTGKKLDLNVTIQPVVDFSFTDNVRLFAAIMEKGTKNNVKSNGEVNFIYVMKAFMSDVNGKPLSELTIGQPSSHDFSYEFNGDYRLPRTGQDANIIKPAIEHSVENFDYLMFVYWIQDVRTGEVFQSGTFDPRPDLISVNETEMFPVTVYPNPAMNYINVQSDVPFTRLTLVNMMGQTVKDVQPSDNNYHMNLEGITKGIYILRIESAEGVTTKKISVQ